VTARTRIGFGLESQGIWESALWQTILTQVEWKGNQSCVQSAVLYGSEHGV